MNNTSETPNQDTIQQQLELLATHRQRLAILVSQQAHFGAHVPPHIQTSITQAQQALRSIKTWLHSQGVAVTDEPNDETQITITANLSDQPSQNANQTINNQAPNQGAQGIFYGPISFGSIERDNEQQQR